ncbi:hypothetical protein [Liquorilactobacillus mali]|nr:hypothetical protein [Liquorilactobacillus mali]
MVSKSFELPFAYRDSGLPIKDNARNSETELNNIEKQFYQVKTN